MRDLCWLVKTGVILKPVKHDTEVYVRLKYLLPSTKLGQGNVFTHVCHSVHRGSATHTHTHTSVQKPPWADTPPGRHPHGQTPPLQATPPQPTHPPTPVECKLRYGQQADGTHPTVLLECNLVKNLNSQFSQKVK